jgi:hypothetical protein
MASAASYLLAVAAAVVRSWGPILVPGHALLAVGRLILSAGLVVIAVALLGHGSAWATGLRRGARVVGAGYLVLLTGSALPPFSRFGAAIASLGYLSSRTAFLASLAGWAAAAFLAAEAFPDRLPADSGEPSRLRNRRLGLASAVFAAGSALQLISLLTADHERWRGLQPLPFDTVADALAALLTAIAGVAAATAFFEAARLEKGGPTYSEASKTFRRREVLLSLAAGILFLGFALQVVATLSVLSFPTGLGSAESAYYVLMWLSAMAFAAAPLAAAAGFALSARRGPARVTGR